jgi:hypothetical protein
MVRTRVMSSEDCGDLVLSGVRTCKHNGHICRLQDRGQRPGRKTRGLTLSRVAPIIGTLGHLNRFKQPNARTAPGIEPFMPELDSADHRTDLIYQRDSYARAFDAYVVAIDNDSRSVVLDRTAFYPTGGGQPHDTGSLAAANDERVWRVTGARKAGSTVQHVIDGNDPLPDIGDSVTGIGATG